jgi:NAD(P)-dependent dehydrogenase (short-subunit alcohol dehydrogenase family)
MGTDRKVALVTGGGSGIGEASALELARNGSDIVLIDIRQDEVERVAAEVRAVGREALAIVCDVGDDKGMAAAFGQVKERFGRLDQVLVNAGINGMWAPIEDMTPEEWDTTIRVNLRGSYLTVHHAVPLMQDHGGSVVIISSVNGTRTFTTAGATAYSVTKAGQFAMGQMLALELSRFKIRVNVICPGSVQTHIGERTWRRRTEEVKVPAVFPEGTIPLTRSHKGALPAEIAKAVSFLCSDAASHITGTPIWIDGGQSLLI